MLISATPTLRLLEGAYRGADAVLLSEQGDGSGRTISYTLAVPGAILNVPVTWVRDMVEP